MEEEITLEGLDEQVCLRGGTPVSTIRGGKSVVMDRRLAVIQALESHGEAEDKFKVYALGMRFEDANGSLDVSPAEVLLIKAAIGDGWPQPGIYVPLCEWLKGKES